MSGRMLDEVIEVNREGKPRLSGITVASDLFKAVDAGSLEESAEYIDFVKIGLSMPLIVERTKLLERIHRYHDLGIRVMSGGTLIEIAVQKGVVSQVLEGLRTFGFDMVEVSEFAGEMPLETKQKVVDSVLGHSMDFIFEVGRREKPETSTAYLISKIQEARQLKSRKVVVEIPTEGRNHGRMDGQGEIVWDVTNELAGTFGPPNLVFENRYVRHLTALILEFGPAVNLAGVPLDEVLFLETQRLGLSSETLGLARPVRSFEGSPAAKFVYHLIRTEHPIDQSTLCLRSGLPRRTVQAAISSLVEGGLVREVFDSSDLRRHRYTID
jgi:phosphosulfolactate synthase